MHVGCIHNNEVRGCTCYRWSRRPIVPLVGGLFTEMDCRINLVLVTSKLPQWQVRRIYMYIYIYNINVFGWKLVRFHSQLSRKSTEKTTGLFGSTDCHTTTQGRCKSTPPFACGSHQRLVQQGLYI